MSGRDLFDLWGTWGLTFERTWQNQGNWSTSCSLAIPLVIGFKSVAKKLSKCLSVSGPARGEWWDALRNSGSVALPVFIRSLVRDMMDQIVEAEDLYVFKCRCGCKSDFGSCTSLGQQNVKYLKTGHNEWWKLVLHFFHPWIRPLSWPHAAWKVGKWGWRLRSRDTKPCPIYTKTYLVETVMLA